MKKWLLIRRLVQLSVPALLLAPRWNEGVYFGNLSSGRLLGVEIADPLSALELTLAAGAPYMPLVTAALTILAVYTVINARVFCSWICPVGLMAEALDSIRARLGVKTVDTPLYYKYATLAFALGASAFLSVPVFTSFSPIITTGRFFYFGAAKGAVAIVAAALLADAFVARRFWCRSICPVGAFYAIFARLAPMRIRMNHGRCTGCGKCSKVCVAPEVLEAPVKFGSDVKSGECTLCMNCVDICPEKALSARPFPGRSGAAAPLEQH